MLGCRKICEAKDDVDTYVQVKTQAISSRGPLAFPSFTYSQVLPLDSREISNRYHHTSVLVPAQEWVLSTPGLVVLDIGPPLEKALVS